MTDTDALDVTRDQPVTPYEGESWETLVGQAHEVFGADLEKGNLLIGVPFVIVRMTFRPGDYMRSDIKGKRGDYVSLNVVTGDQASLDKAVRRGRIPVEPCPVDPMEHLLVNEGGTGAYRQSVEYLEATNRIILPEGPQGGSYGECRFDTPVSEWDYPETSRYELRFTPDGDHVVIFDTRLYCPRGMRVSEYENEYTKEGVTRYLA